MWDEVNLQSFVRVSVARVFDEPTGLRELIQASSRTALYFSRPCPRHSSHT
jgi:hypothetical protein